MHVFAHPLPPSCTGGTPLFPLNRRHTDICPTSFLPTPYNTQAARAIRPPLVGACCQACKQPISDHLCGMRVFAHPPSHNRRHAPQAPRSCCCQALPACRPPPPFLIPSPPTSRTGGSKFAQPHVCPTPPPPLQHTQAARPLRLLQLLPKTASPPRPPSSTCPSHQQHHNHHNRRSGTPLLALTLQPCAQALHPCMRARSACLQHHHHPQLPQVCSCTTLPQPLLCARHAAHTRTHSSSSTQHATVWVGVHTAALARTSCTTLPMVAACQHRPS